MDNISLNLPNNTNIPIKSKLLLMGIWLFHVVNNFIWLKIDSLPLYGDAGLYIYESLKYFKLLCHPTIQSIREAINLSAHPPLVPLLLIPKYLMFGFGVDSSVLLINSLFMGILIISMFLITKKITDNLNAALFSSFLVTFYPMVFVMSRSFLLDLPLLSLVPLSIYFLLRTNNFENKRYSLISGIIMGVGLLTKWTYPIFIAGPFLLIVLRGIKNNRIRKKVLCNMALSLIMSIIIVSFWYIPNLTQIIDYAIWDFKEFAPLSSPPLLSIESSIFYIKWLWWQIVLLCLPFLISVCLFTKTKFRRERLILLSWIVIPFLVFTFLIPVKNPRFTVPYLGGIAIFTSVGILSMSLRIRKIIYTFTYLIGTLQFFVFSYDVNITKVVQKVFDDFGEFHLTPRHEDWKMEEVLSIIKENTKDPLRAPQVVLLVCMPPYEDGGVFKYLAIMMDFDISVIDVSLSKDPVFFATSDRETFIVAKDALKTFWNWDWINEKYNQGYTYVMEHPDRFLNLYKAKLPDGSHILLFKKN